MTFQTVVRSRGLLTRPYPELWAAQTVNYLGDQVYAVALPWLVYDRTRSGSAMEVTFAASMLPYLFFGVVGGLSADEGRRRRTLLAGNVVAAAAVSALCAAGALGVGHAWVFVVVALALAAATSYSASAAESMVPLVFTESSDLRRANSYLEASNSTSQVLGPGLAGVIIATLSAVGALGVDAASFAIAAAVFAFCVVDKPAPPRRVGPGRYGLGELAARWWAGVRWLVHHRLLRAGTALSTLNNLVLGGFDTLLILILRHSDHLPAESVAAVVACGGAGAVLSSSLLVSRLRVRRCGVVMIAAIACCGAATATIGAVPELGVVAGAEFAFGAAATIFNVLWRTVRQRVAGPEMVGRAAGACRGIAFCGAALEGLGNAGLLALGVPAPALFVSEGAAVTLTAGLFLLGPLAGMVIG